MPKNRMPTHNCYEHSHSYGGGLIACTVCCRWADDDRDLRPFAEADGLEIDAVADDGRVTWRPRQEVDAASGN